MGKIVLTGSRAYGPVSEDSDIDIVMEKKDALKLFEVLNENGVNLIREKDYGDTSSFKFAITDALPSINIIIAESDVDLFKWEYATNMMKGINLILDREKRIEVFHRFQNEGFEMYMQKEGRKFYEEYKRTHGVQPFSEAGPLKVQTVGGFTGFIDDDVTPF